MEKLRSPKVMKPPLLSVRGGLRSMDARGARLSASAMWRAALHRSDNRGAEVRAEAMCASTDSQQFTQRKQRRFGRRRYAGAGWAQRLIGLHTEPAPKNRTIDHMAGVGFGG